MSITVVQSKTGTSTSSSSLTLTLNSGTTAGNSLILCIGEFTASGSGGPSPGLTAKLGTTSMTTVDQWEDTNANVAAEIWVLDNIAGGQTSVPITFIGTNTDNAAMAFEVSGLNPSGSLDKVVAADNDFTTSGSWSTGNTATLTQPSEIAVGVACLQGTAISVTGPSSPWSNTTTSISTTFKLICGTNIVNATTGLAYAGSATATGSGNEAAVIATFKAVQPLGAVLVSNRSQLAVQRAANY